MKDNLYDTNRGDNHEGRNKKAVIILGVVAIVGVLAIVLYFCFSSKSKEYGVNEYNVVFNSNGGSDIVEGAVINDNVLTKPEDPVREGYVFKGWYLGDEEFDFNSKIKKDIVLVAKWEEATGENDGTNGGTDKNNSGSNSSGSSQENGISYGDTDLNGIVNHVDGMLISQHVEGIKKLTDQALKNADINGDGNVNRVDSVLVSGVYVQYLKHDISKPLTNYVLYGDANNDGVVNNVDGMLISQHVEGTKKLSGQGLKNADINGDGNVSGADSVLVLGAYTKYLNHDIFKAITNYVLYGDANNDGVVNNVDGMLISQHVDGTKKLTGQGLKNADINGDGNVNNADSVLALAVYTKKFNHDILRPLNDYILYGDANNDGVVNTVDGKLILQHIDNSKKLTGQALKNADINGDGSVNRIDSVLVSGVYVKHVNHDILKPLTDYILYGDVNIDGVINNDDASLIVEHYTSKITLTGQALKNADVNADGVVNTSDGTLVLQYVSGQHQNVLPYKPVN